MNDSGFNGTGSRFNSRFEAGSPIYAKQLNDLAAGVQAALPQPYVGYGPSVSYTPGGGIIAGYMEDTPVGDGNRCPLSIYNLLPKDGAYYINIAPGAVNNLIVKSDDGVLLTNDPPPEIQVFSGGLSTTKTENFIYIRCGNTAQSGSTEAQYPSRSGEGYPSIRVREAADRVDDNDYSYILIGVVSGIKELIPGSDPPAYSERFTIQQLIGCNSLWSERFRCGTSPATYWWSAV